MSAPMTEAEIRDFIDGPGPIAEKVAVYGWERIASTMVLANVARKKLINTATELATLRARCDAAEAEVDRLSAWPQPQAEEIARLRACVDLNQRGHVHQIEQAVESQNRAIAAEARIRMLLDVLETVTECEEHRPCGLCRERIRRAVEVKP